MYVARNGIIRKSECPYQNVAWGEKQAEKAQQGLVYFNSVLANSTYVAGEQFSVADITLYAGLVFAGFAQIAIPTELTHLIAWQQKVAQRQSIAAIN